MKEKTKRNLKKLSPVLVPLAIILIADFFWGIELSSEQYLLVLLLGLGLAAIYDKLSNNPLVNVLVNYQIQVKGVDFDYHILSKRMEFPIVPRVGDYLNEYGENFGQVSGVILQAADIEFGNVTDAHISCLDEVGSEKALQEIVEELVGQGWHDKHHYVERDD